MRMLCFKRWITISPYFPGFNMEDVKASFERGVGTKCKINYMIMNYYKSQLKISCLTAFKQTKACGRIRRRWNVSLQYLVAYATCKHHFASYIYFKIHYCISHKEAA